MERRLDRKTERQNEKETKTETTREDNGRYYIFICWRLKELLI